MRRLRIIPDIIERGAVEAVSSSSSVHQAARCMAERDLGALPVNDENGNLVGVLTDGDITRRVTAAGLDPTETPVERVMTARPDTLMPDDSASDALELMRARSLIYIPVVDDGHMVGMVSVLDLCAVVTREMEKGFRKLQSQVFDHPHKA